MTDKPHERQTCVVSHFVFRADARPLSARREAPTDEQDSGWMFLSGHPDEDQPGFGDDPNSWRRIMLSELIARFPRVASIIDHAEGTEWEWNDVSHAYEPSGQPR